MQGDLFQGPVIPGGGNISLESNIEKDQMLSLRVTVITQFFSILIQFSDPSWPELIMFLLEQWE